MKFSLVALSLLLVPADAWVQSFRQTAPQFCSIKQQQYRRRASLQAIDLNQSSAQENATGEPAAEPQASSGTVLEGGKVIDFSSVKAPSMAEEALNLARQKLESGHVVPSSTLQETILGINDDVIKEVGHPLGEFCTEAEVQEVATWLRSQTGMFGDASTSYTEEQVARFKTILAKAYEESGEVTSAYAKTFYMGTAVLGPEARAAIWAVYVWCRRTDEIVDAPRPEANGDTLMMLDLASWQMRLEDLWDKGSVVDVFDLCLLDIRIKYPTLDIIPYTDMVRGMLMDIPELGVERYETFDDLHLYCYRVAGTVGLMSLPIFGCAEGYTDELAKEPALSLGVAFQLTNILRDVGEDAELRQRIYLPREDMEAFGITEEQIYEKRLDDNYVRMMEFQINRAREYYERARRGVFMLAPESRLPVQLSLDAYGRILDKIEANGYDSLNFRAYVDKWEKLSIIPSSWYRTLDISKWLPLPGDPTVPDKA